MWNFIACALYNKETNLFQMVSTEGNAETERGNIVCISGDELCERQNGITFFSFSFYRDGFRV